MSVKLSESWSLKSDSKQWILTELYNGKDKDGKDKRQSRESYHSTIKQVAAHLVDKEAKAASGIGEMLLIMGATVEKIENSLKGISK